MDPSEPRRAWTKDEVLALRDKYRTWRRRGADDELGTVYFLTPERIAGAAGVVRLGKVSSCALPVPQQRPDVCLKRVNPIRVMLQDGGGVAFVSSSGISYARDAIYMPLQCGPQCDALSHIFGDGKMYNWGRA